MKNIIVILILFVSGCAQLKPKDLPLSGEIISSGIYEPYGEHTYLNTPDSTMRYSSEYDGFRLISSNQEITAVEGITLGIEYRLRGKPNKNYKVELLIEHPPMTRPDGTISTRSLIPLSVTMDENGYDRNFIMYSITEPYEKVSGDWAFKLLSSHNMILSKIIVTK